MNTTGLNLSDKPDTERDSVARSFASHGGTVYRIARFWDPPTLDVALTHAVSLPRTVVVDVGFIDGRGWSVIEFNAAWGSGLNGCDPDKVLPAILAASGPQFERNLPSQN